MLTPFVGDVNASQELILGPTAVVDGRLSAGSLHVEEGELVTRSSLINTRDGVTASIFLRNTQPLNLIGYL